ncbi:MAG TPA: DUF3306 domain-containing protein [Burkholderiales bacterium]
MNETRKEPEPATGDQSETFLRRWARRKQEARVEPPVPPVAQPPAVEVAKPPERILTDADMPPLESLGEKSDFSMFFATGVSEGLRQRALRKLFTLPSINQRCPLDGEWYDSHGYEPLGNIITHEMREAMEREAEKLKQSAMATPAEQSAAPADSAAQRKASAPAESAVAPAAQRAVGETGESLPSDRTREPSVRKETNG